MIITLFAAGLSTSLCQTPDFEKLKKEVEEAQNQREKAESLLEIAMKLPPPMTDSSFAIAEQVLNFSEDGDSLYMYAVSEFIRGFTYYRKQLPDSARVHFLTAQSLLKDQNESLYYSTFNFLGLVYFRKRQFDSALQVYDMLKELPDTARLKIAAYGNSGRIYREMGEYAMAIDNFEMTVKLDSNNQFNKVNSFLNIASMFQEMEMYEKGVETLLQVDIGSVRPQPVVVAYYNNLGGLQFEMGDYDAAFENLQKGLSLATKLRQFQLTVRNRMLIAQIFAEKEQFDSAMQYLTDARAAVKLGRIPPSGVAQLDLTLAEVFYKMEEFDSAIFYASKVVNSRRPWITPQNRSLLLLADAYDAKGEIEQSKEYYKQHTAFLDTLQNSYRIRFQEDAKAKYLLNQKEQEISEAQSQYESLETWQKVLLILVIVLVLGGFILYLYLQKSKIELDKASEKNIELSKEVARNKSEIIELKSKALVPVDDIISIKSDGHYLEFYLSSKSNPEVDRNRIKEILDMLPSKFVQIHRSYVVNIDHIKVKYADKVVLKDGNELPVSRTYKQRLAEALEKRQ
jgi:DNA-binding LytR/AlgR family response regulator/lipoprotein NlpI